jgi:hypothetical protein
MTFSIVASVLAFIYAECIASTFSVPVVCSIDGPHSSSKRESAVLDYQAIFTIGIRSKFVGLLYNLNIL